LEIHRRNKDSLLLLFWDIGGFDMVGSLALGILVVVALIVAALVLKFVVLSGGGGVEDLPYERAALFSPAERSFLGVLEQAVGGQSRVLGKVRLGDVVKVKSGQAAGARQSAFNRIQSKHVDFVVCDPATLTVQFVVELDDKSHQQSSRRERDAFVDKTLEAAGIPIFHFAAKRSYSLQDVRDTLLAVGRPAVAAGAK
jgi:very-short-patch-repair endonuclease